MWRDEDAVIPETEPEVVHDVLVGELFAVQVAGAIRFTGTTVILDTHGRPTERRVVLRFTVPVSGVASVCAAVCGKTGKDEH